MELALPDICAFLGFILFVVAFAMIASRKERTSDDYFLAGRRLTWWLIGISLIASNISTEHFVGMAGRGYELGLAIAGYEWTAAVAMVLVALFLLPKFLRIGITTIPEYLEHRYSASARGLMAFYMMVAYVFVAIAAVLYAGSLNLRVIFGDAIEKALLDFGLVDQAQIAQWGEDWLLVGGVWAIGIVAGIYTVWGGLKAVVWADLFNGLGLLVGGILVAFFGFLALGQLTAEEDAAQDAKLAQIEAADIRAGEEDEGAKQDPEADAPPKPSAKDEKTPPPSDADAEAKPDADADAPPKPGAKDEKTPPPSDADAEAKPGADADAPPKPSAKDEKTLPPSNGDDPDAEGKPDADEDPPAEPGAKDEKSAPSDPEPSGKKEPATEAGKKSAVSEADESTSADTQSDKEADAAPTADAAPDAEGEADAESDFEPPPMPAPPVEMAWHKRLVLGVNTFFAKAGEKLSAVKPFGHGEIPWIAVFIGGLWIPQLFYWGLNQFIGQRALGARSVSQGQKGVLFAACLKLLIPFIIVFPAIMAFQLFSHKVSSPDEAYPHLIKEILPAGLRGLMLAALFGAVMSSLDSMLNSASTIFTMDLYKRHLKKDASNRGLIRLGRLMTALFVVLSCLWAPFVAKMGDGSLFNYIQQFWGFLSPGIVTAFLFGILSKRTPPIAAVGAMLLGIPIYAWCWWMTPEVAFLYHMAFTFIALAAYMMLLTILMPLKDVEASSAQSEAGADQPGFLKHRLVPFGTAFLGALLLVHPVFYLSHIVLSKWQHLLWVHLTSAGGFALFYFAVTLFVMRRPTPSVRKVVAKAPRPSFIRWTARWLFVRPVFALVAAAVLGLHVYLFGVWVSAELPTMAQTTPAMEPCVTFLEPYVTESFDVTLPAIVRDRDPAVPVVVPEEVEEIEEVDEEALAGEEGPEDEGEGEAEEGGASVEEVVAAAQETVVVWPHLRQEVVQRTAIDGDFVRETRSMPIFIVPLVLAAICVALFWIGLLLIWRQPAPGQVEVQVTDKIDLKPSALVRVWGLLVIVAVGALYWAFF